MSAGAGANKGLTFGQDYNYQLVKAQIEAVSAQGDTALIEPTRSKYSNKEEWLNEIGIHSTFWHDVYLVLTSFDMKTQQAVLKMHINPTVKLVWTSLVIMVIGALVGLSHGVRKRSIDVSASGLALESVTGGMEGLLDEILEKDPFRGPVHETSLATGTGAGKPVEGLTTSIVLIVLAVALSVFGFSGVAWAQVAPASGSATLSSAPSAQVIQVNPRLRDIGEELRCPTCNGISILESETPQSVAMKAEIEKQLVAGKTKDEILDFFKTRYGDWILRKPDSRSVFGFWVWAIPVTGLLVGPLVLILALRKSRERAVRERAELLAELRAFMVSQGGTPRGSLPTSPGGA